MNKKLRELLPGVVGSLFMVAFVGIIASALHNPRPHNLPVAVIAPAQISTQLQKAADMKFPDAIEVKTYSSQENAIQDLRKEKVYGVVALGQAGVQATVSSASGEASKQVVSALASGAATQARTKATIKDITPQASGAGHALTMMFLVLATTIATLLGQAMMINRKEEQSLMTWLAASAIAVVLVGLSGATIAMILGEFKGAFWGVFAALASCGFASAAILAGMQNIFGKKGFGITALLLIPLGVATSGAVANQYFLPAFYSAIAPYMLSSATIDAIRQAAYLNNAAVGHLYVVLGTWAALGLAMRAIKVKS